MSAALAYQFEDSASLDAANDNTPLSSAAIIKMSTASRCGHNSQTDAADAAAPFSLSFIPRMNDLNARAMALRAKTHTVQPLEAYDALTNRLTQSAESASGPDGAVTRHVGYDARGNITTLGGLSFDYDMSDQPRTISGTNRTGEAVSGGSYVYDGHFKRVKSVVNGVTRYNVYDQSGQLAHVEEDDGNYASETDYLTAGGMTLARIKNGVFTYMHADHLGSASAGTKEDGTTAFTEFHTPFGEALLNASANDNQSDFTGHIRDKDTGLLYMQARYMDPNIGRFLSIDPVGFLETGSPSYFNRYAYVANDPVNGIDPTGMVIECANGGSCTNEGGTELFNTSGVSNQNRGAVNNAIESMSTGGNFQSRAENTTSLLGSSTRVTDRADLPTSASRVDLGASPDFNINPNTVRNGAYQVSRRETKKLAGGDAKIIINNAQSQTKVRGWFRRYAPVSLERSIYHESSELYEGARRAGSSVGGVNIFDDHKRIIRDTNSFMFEFSREPARVLVGRD